MMTDSILELPEWMAALPPVQRELGERLFEVTAMTGELVVPPELAPMLAEWFAEPGDAGPDDAIARASRQRVVRTFNRYSGEGALFNELRARRPMQGRDPADLDQRIAEATKGGMFASPLTMTTADTWGRIEGKHSVSAANAAMYDAHHGLVICREPHPHHFNREQVADYLDVAWRWLERVHADDPALRYPFIAWNCLEKAGASIPHGHLQMLITRDRPYAVQMRLEKAAELYHADTGRSYWPNWIAVHKALRLAVERKNVTIAVSITPVKEKETLVIGHDRMDRAFADVLTDVLRCFIDQLGVISFNVGIYLPPFGADDEPTMPVIARCVDRGDPARPTVDVAAMELYGTPVVASDPYRVFAAIRKS